MMKVLASDVYRLVHYYKDRMRKKRRMEVVR